MWTDIDGFDGYEVSDSGFVRNRKTGRELSQFPNNRGYLRVSIRSSVDGKYRNVLVHRLVAAAYVSNDNQRIKTQVNHINEVKSDNRACNLEWISPSENVNYETGIARRAKTQSYSVVMHYKGIDVYFDSAQDVERRTGIPAKSVQKCCVGKLSTSHGALFRYTNCEKVVDE